jgi:hypothetical protein
MATLAVTRLKNSDLPRFCVELIRGLPRLSGVSAQILEQKHGLPEME